MRRSALLLTTLLLGWRPVSAQVSAGELVDAWRSGWQQADTGAPIEADERSVRTVEGPRGTVQVEVDGRVLYPAAGPPVRTTERLRADGRDLGRADARHRRRIGRAFGPAGRGAAAPALRPDQLLAGARASDLAPAWVDETPAWRVTLTGERGESQAWFTRSARAPRLLAVRTERGRGRSRLVREVRYVRVDGLDLPSEVRARATVRQRRRLRDYVVTLTAVTTYAGHRTR